MRVLFVSLSLTLLGCASTYIRQVTERAESDFACPAAVITVEDVGGHGYRATGCRKTATYVCAGRNVCVLDTEIADAAEQPEQDPHASLARFYVGYGPQMRECIGSVQLTLDFDTTGRVAAIQPWSMETPTARTCLAYALAQARLSVPPREAMSFTFNLADIESGGVPVAERTESVAEAHSDRDSVEPASTQSGEEGEQAPEQQAELRAALDAHAADILACTSTDRALLHVEWSSAATTISLGNDLAGTDAEGCVRSVIGPLPTPTTAQGTLLHLVRATP